MRKQRNLIRETKENEKISKNEIGITLISLVVTIIILIILAGISIGSLSGEKGIIDNAKFAKNETNKAKVEEEIYLAILEAEQENENASLQNVKDKLKEKEIISEDSQVDENGKITTNEGYEFEGKLNDYLGIEIGNGDTDDSNDNNNSDTSQGSITQEELDNLKKEVEESINLSSEQTKQLIEKTKEELKAEYETKLFYNPGEQIRLSGISMGGYCTSNAMEYFMSVTLGKPISPKVKSVTVGSGMTVRIRQNGYYLLGSGLGDANIDDLSVKIFGFTENILSLVIQVPSKHMNSTNNDSIGVEINNLLLTFN